MKIFSWNEVGSGLLLNSAAQATMGVFDGLHLGHRTLIQQILHGLDTQSLVITFRQNPKKILYGENYSGDLMSCDEKLAELLALGVQAVLLIDFSKDFSRMTGREFFLRLKESFVFEKIVLGWDFSFGKDSATAASEVGWLADPQTELLILPPVEVDGQLVSSSAIRKAVQTGNFPLARRFLEQPYFVEVPATGVFRDGKVFFSRSDMKKVLPLEGRFKVLVDNKPQEIVFEKDVVFWESPPGVLYKKIHFL